MPIPNLKQWKKWSLPSKASYLGLVLAIFLGAFTIFAYVTPYDELRGEFSTESVQTPPIAIEIPVRIYNALGVEVWMQQEAEFYILKPETPLMDAVVYSGMTRIQRPDNITTINDRYPVSQNSEIEASIILPKEPEVEGYLNRGGYKLRLLVRPFRSNEYLGYGEIMLDEYGVTKGIEVSLDYDNTPSKSSKRDAVNGAPS